MEELCMCYPNFYGCGGCGGCCNGCSDSAADTGCDPCATHCYFDDDGNSIAANSYTCRACDCGSTTETETGCACGTNCSCGSSCGCGCGTRCGGGILGGWPGLQALFGFGR